MSFIKTKMELLKQECDRYCEEVSPQLAELQRKSLLTLLSAIKTELLINKECEKELEEEISSVCRIEEYVPRKTRGDTSPSFKRTSGPNRPVAVYVQDKPVYFNSYAEAGRKFKIARSSFVNAKKENRNTVKGFKVSFLSEID